MMKYFSILVLLFCIVNQTLAQRLPESQQPVIKNITHHQKDFKQKLKILDDKSFYQSKDQWQAIIDSTWGEGQSYDFKMRVFNAFANAITNEFDGFNSLGMSIADWDSLRNAYNQQITDSTSHGKFAAIMDHLASELKDLHTWIENDSILNTPLNPGVPVLLISGFFNSIAHFGAVLTVLPDSNLLVIRTVDAHPLNLQPGDVILGYEGVRWKYLVNELLDARLPAIAGWPGSPSAYQDALLITAGLNWHLFETIDILKYESGDTLHLSVTPLLDLPDTPMLNNDQVPLNGIPFPDFHQGQTVSSGIVEGTNIGYIYIYSEDGDATDREFHEALLPLLNTDGLIIDLRLNFGGWSLFDDSFEIIFNEYLQTIEDSYRCNTSDTDLCPFGNSDWFEIPGDPHSIFDRPIGVLIGPTCVSMGDITAQRLRYHPMVKFFGKSPAASMGDNLLIENYDQWTMRYSISDMFHVTQPDEYLNRSEFPVDFPVWHTPDDVANGEDAVVNRAVDWINNLSFAHDVTVDKMYAEPQADSVLITATVENPQMNDVTITAILLDTADAAIDTLSLVNDGDHGDGEPEDSLWGIYYIPENEKMFTISLKSEDLDDQTLYTLRKVQRFTSIGPVVFSHYEFTSSDTIPNHGDRLRCNIYLKNNGTTASAYDIRIKASNLDSCTSVVAFADPKYDNIAAGAIAEPSRGVNITFNENCPDSIYAQIKVDIFSGDFIFWTDTLSIFVHMKPVGLADENNSLPKQFALPQNYPNPFNPRTKINYELPITNDVELTIHNVLGQKVATLVSEKKKAGYHQVEWDASAFASGVYYYKIVAGDFLQVRKMVLLK